MHCQAFSSLNLFFGGMLHPLLLAEALKIKAVKKILDYNKKVIWRK